MRRGKIFCLVLVLLLGMFLVYGCAPGEGSTPAQTEKQEVFKWTMQSTWSAAVPPHKMAEKFVEEVNLASGGRIVIDLQPSGTIVPAFEVLDAVNNGVLDAGWSCSTYWMGKQRVLSLFTSVPGGFDPTMAMTWLFERGGLELYQKAYDEAGFGIKVIPSSITHPEIFLHSHKPITSVEDFKGLKLRAAADFVDIFERLGASVVMLPGEEVYPSLERKVIDAAEFGTPTINRILGFNEITEYVHGPGLHQPACVYELLINQDVWNKMPTDLQKVVEIAARSTMLWAWTNDLSESMKSVEFLEEYGNKLVTIDEELQREFLQVSWEYLDELSEKDPLVKETWSSMKEFYLDFVKYEKFILPIRAE